MGIHDASIKHEQMRMSILEQMVHLPYLLSEPMLLDVYFSL
jgi:hypothetical protein